MARACNGEANEILHRILNSKSFFGRLNLESRVTEISIVKRQYRSLALIVHPDKCSNEFAKEAFQKLSEAFDALSTEEGQKNYLAELGGGQPRIRKRRPSHPSTNHRWWNTKTWDEFEKRFRHRDAAEFALRQEFADAVKAKYLAKRIRLQVLNAERSAENCDRSAGFPASDLWPPQSRPQNDASRVEGIDMESRPELEQLRYGLDRLLELLTHLRTVHRYCLYCGCVFDSFEDLELNCPGITEDKHDAASSIASRPSNETSIEPASQIEIFEEDPLDAFMVGMHNEAQNEMKSSLNSTKRRLQPAKGWSFEQQAQQNKNERKRMKRG